MKRTLSALALVLLAIPSLAQTSAVIYSLPRTTIRIEAEARTDRFTAGPYASYAEKYFGVPAPTGNSTTCTLQEISLTPYVEADPQARYTISLSERGSAAFLQLCSQGLVMMSDNFTGRPAAWRFLPQEGAAPFEGIEPSGSLGKETTTLYKAVRTDEGYERVPVTQEDTVEKSPDRKAADAAAAIVSLREKRQQIATGDTDATFSGEALQAAIDEIKRLEERYLALFYGQHEISVEKKVFDVTPVPGEKGLRATAFRISDRKGLLPASVNEGKPVNIEFVIEQLSEAEGSADRSKETLVHYRIPAVTRCRLSFDGELLLESRIPVYQLGEESTIPLNVLIAR